ncbi:indole-3-glycerol phosphate synthase TrpC [Alicyclobacillus acidiphilus]|jgi:indole-3-glycerol phosphate synthase|uniref:indole-3-glycerol phosphate synthase TrpC n=1 Tax=Alicyclobacillus acidiphilus TaxID=182455 RepID=UPI0008333E87|nr:indole-3-glycerol phosphate synthase TrpC [Alicyclobacillus acidiphilus]
MSILDNILATKAQEVAELRERKARGLSIARVRATEVRSLAKSLQSRASLGLVAEIKRKSPSKGVIQAEIDPVARAKVYEEAGASAISVLTDREYFQGTLDDLIAVREAVSIPVLRKDFIIDELQIDEAYSAGADVILLIAAAMAPDRLKVLSAYAQREYGLEVLLEVHGEDEVEHALAAEPTIIGINNRNLHTFDVDLAVTERVLRRLPANTVAISESGIFGADDAVRMAGAGAKGVLVGELLMRHVSLADVAACVSSLQVPLPASSAVDTQ